MTWKKQRNKISAFLLHFQILFPYSQSSYDEIVQYKRGHTDYVVAKYFRSRFDRVYLVAACPS